MKSKLFKGGDGYFNLYSVLCFFTPLIYLTGTNEIFEFPKTFFVYFMAIAIFAVYAFDVIFKDNFKPVVILPSLPVMFFFLSFIISTIFSSELRTSIWGYYTRFNDGLVSMFAYFVIYFVAVNKLSEHEFAKIVKISLCSVAVSGSLGVLQHFGGFTQTWGGGEIERAFSTLGQPNWFAQFLGMQLVLIFYFYLRDKLSRFWAALFIIGFSGMWFAYSVSGILGFVFGMFVLFAILYFRKMLLKKDLIRSVLLLGICLVIALSSPGIFYAKLQDAFNDISKKVMQIVPNVYAESQNLVSDPGFIRLGMWEGTVKLIFSSPKVFLIGTGPETFPYAFQKFRPMSVNYSSEWEYVLNKPHNYYLEVFAEQGVLGLISFLLLFGYVIKKSRFWIVPALAVFFATNLFGWPVVSVSLFFWFITAFSEVANSEGTVK